MLVSIARPRTVRSKQSNMADSVLAGNANSFGCFQMQSLVHANADIGVIAFVFRHDLSHGFGKILVLPRIVLVLQVFSKGLPGYLENPTVHGDLSLDPAVIGLNGNEF